MDEDVEVGRAIATTVRRVRSELRLSVNQLAAASGVSRAMIGKIERCEAQPTAALLARLAAALGMTLSDLLADAEGGDRRLTRREEQPLWTDPDTGYERRAVSPVAGRPLQLVEVRLPGAAAVTMEPESYVLIHQQIWVLEGTLHFQEGENEFVLEAGDCLQLGEPARCTFANRSGRECRYLVALTRR